MEIFHYLLVWTLFSFVLPRLAPKQFTVSELFAVCGSVCGNFVHYGVQCVWQAKTRQHTVGRNDFNAMVFLPWVWLTISLTAVVSLNTLQIGNKLIQFSLAFVLSTTSTIYFYSHVMT